MDGDENPLEMMIDNQINWLPLIEYTLDKLTPTPYFRYGICKPPNPTITLRTCDIFTSKVIRGFERA